MNGISIIICTYNGKSKLKETLSAILQLQATCAWELLIVDNASTDGTAEYVSELLDNSSIDWRLLHELQPGLIHARLCGLSASKYDILLYCDDDNTLDKNYLEIGYDIIKDNPKLGALGGCGIPVFENTKPDWFDMYGHSFAVGSQSAKDGKLTAYPAELYGAGTFFRKAVLLYFLDKGFKSALSGRTATNLVSGEDVEWCYLIQLVGYQIWYDHRLTFMHLMPEGRMNWDYYLRLKKGIASGVCKLLPYSFLFKNPNGGNWAFLLQWFKETCFTTLIFIKNCFVNNGNSLQNELIQVIWQAKMFSFWQNGYVAYKQYLHVKNLIGSLKEG